jgi:hypothetical protein
VQVFAVHARDDSGKGELCEAEGEDDDSLHCERVATIDIPYGLVVTTILVGVEDGAIWLRASQRGQQSAVMKLGKTVFHCSLDAEAPR